MANKSRVPMQVSPEYEKVLKELQINIMKKQGKNISLRDLTEVTAKVIDIEKLEQAILNNPNLDIKISLDRRKK